MRGPLLHLKNGWADFAQILYTVSDNLERWLAQVIWSLSLRVRTCSGPVLYLKNGWADCAQIWYVTLIEYEKGNYVLLVR